MLFFVRCIKIATLWPPKLFNNQAFACALYQNRYPLTPILYDCLHLEMYGTRICLHIYVCLYSHCAVHAMSSGESPWTHVCLACFYFGMLLGALGFLWAVPAHLSKNRFSTNGSPRAPCLWAIYEQSMSNLWVKQTLSFAGNLGGAKEGPEAPHLMALVRALYQNRYTQIP